jgi:hypothetical protein
LAWSIGVAQPLPSTPFLFTRKVKGRRGHSDVFLGPLLRFDGSRWIGSRRGPTAKGRKRSTCLEGLHPRIILFRRRVLQCGIGQRAMERASCTRRNISRRGGQLMACEESCRAWGIVTMYEYSLGMVPLWGRWFSRTIPSGCEDGGAVPAMPLICTRGVEVRSRCSDVPSDRSADAGRSERIGSRSAQ